MARISKKLDPKIPFEPAPAPEPEATSSVFTSVPEEPQAEQQSQQPETTPFDSMLDSEYNRVLDEQITKALAKTQERFGRMMSQERGLADKPKDKLGYNTDDYENMIKGIRARDLNVGSSREEVYQQLYDLKFTEMRKLDLIKQEFNRGTSLT